MEDREFVECTHCGEKLPIGKFCYKISGEFYCEPCGREELEFRFGTFVEDWDCCEFQENVDEQWREWSAEGKEELDW